MSWTPLAERFAALPLILAGPLLRRVEPQSVTVWLALKETRMVTLRVYARDEGGNLIQQCEGTQHTVRLGDRLHIVAVTARAGTPLRWGGLYCYDLFFQSGDQGEAAEAPAPETADHLDTPGILNIDPSRADPLHRLVYPGHPLPSFVLPPEDINQLRVVHGSCRKPHGEGREMLSALDTILASAIQQGKDRPQQLFLTGDQIYADDVAAPLLFALIDAGTCLFAGNDEEILPLAGVPARELAPGTRGPIVRTGAMFTTGHGQNHLLALSEYAAMYLFAWSDVPWPADLPDAQEIWDAYPQALPESDDRQKVAEEYAAQCEQLRAFRSLLPQVRRALANIATYTICDDHDVTDDWFLDGAWCQRVLDSPLGRRIVRNGLLAFALFQAWGNTPEQFAEQNGMTLLNAVDTWRGDASDARLETIEELIGLPAAFEGEGELPHSPRALHWHHSYDGLHFQIVLMDTRTRRLYRSPHDFPGLLSPDAMHAQVANVARQDAEVTIIISATPVLGVDFIESVQVWSHLIVRENYAYDCEAWGLEWATFQHFIKTVSALKRVVILSGDVHYGFGSSMEYWDRNAHNTARLVNYTSSPFCNEGAGAHLAVLAIGYPRLLHLLRRNGTPTLDFFAWDIDPNDRHVLNQILSLIWRRLYLFWWAIPRLLAAYRSRYEIIMPARGWLKGAFKGCPPDRVYRLRYLPNTLAHAPLRRKERLRRRVSAWIIRLLRLPLGAITFLQTGVRRLGRSLLWRASRGRFIAPRGEFAAPRGDQTGLSLAGRVGADLSRPGNRPVAALLHYTTWLNRQKAGELIDGYNNLGEIHFEWDAEKKAVVQRLWYHTDDDAQPLLKTDYHETLDPPSPDAAPRLP